MGRRALRVAEAVREVVASAILFELRDPRVQGVTVTRVEISDDLQVGKIYVSVLGHRKDPSGDGILVESSGDEQSKAESLALRGLRSAGGFLQSKVADRLQMRFTPRLSFYVDEGLKHQLEVSRILREVLPQEPESEADADAGSPEAALADVLEDAPTDGMADER